MIFGRNLFAIDYLKKHPRTTTTEFTDIFKSLDQGTLDVSGMTYFMALLTLPLQTYEDKSRAIKAAIKEASSG
jgi:hypothetical protein